MSATINLVYEATPSIITSHGTSPNAWEDFIDSAVVMSRNSNSKALISQASYNIIPLMKKMRYVLWPFVFGVNLYDFLGLCHLVPTHTLHLSRPFLMSTSTFQVFQKTQTGR
ncbi:uncharacterized protein LOC118748400 [Rhagoletis pomonella]|uniref:uncharacterized protein LOC118748400 n=1 Tax=Rhagoletis pomonella TaxID=28610 RepID=UPI00178166A8|nr:uncharacterized protein LOC118748400 [Rhagoletis pomonella]